MTQKKNKLTESKNASISESYSVDKANINNDSKNSDEIFKKIGKEVSAADVDSSTHKLFLSDVTRVVPQDESYECIMSREKLNAFGDCVYRCFGKDLNKPIILASTSSSLFCPEIHIKDPVLGNIIGVIKSNYTRLIYDIEGPECKFRVEYDENFLGRHGPRTFRVIFEDKQIFLLKPPYIVDGRYYQDFHDLEPVPSIKNFICVPQDDLTREVCTFIRKHDNNFVLRVSNPFSLFSGFALALTSLHTGIFHR